MNRFVGFIRIMRPINCLMMGFAVIVGAVVANADFSAIHWQRLIFGYLTGFLLTAASMVVNDYYDKEIDAVNEPKRPIPSGLIKPKEALIYASLLTTLGFAAAILTSTFASLCFVTALMFWVISITYVTVGKRTGLFGNFLVSACVSAPFVYGSLAIVGAIKLRIWIFASIVFLSNTGREITKGIVDVQGDKASNVKTLAVRYGERKAALTAATFYVLAVALTPLPLLLNLVSILFVPPAIITDLGLVASSIMLIRDFSRENARRVKNHVLIWFFAGLIAFMGGSLG